MKKAIQIANAPAPIAPYSPGILAGNTLYVSGQIPVDPKTGKLVTGDIKEQTRMALESIKAILKARLKY